jgi:hypothetical protein
MMDIEFPPSTQVIAALLASVFYVATYLSFVRLLRYLRNWYAPGFFASLTTGLLAALTVVLVSWSPDGLDRLNLGISIGLIATYFYIIAAPAIAFQPASRPVEFLAKHSDYAGLCLLGPALIAGFVVPNIKLQALLGTAMAIELSWFLRQRWTGRTRRLYPLNGQDLLVLMTQAKGDLVAFRRRHGIRELVLSNSAVSWRGCGRRTPPCPMNLYVNRLGLNTAPCCREHMTKLSHYVAACLSDMGVVHWLEGGTLLGAVREEGKFLDWEDDIDMSVLLDDDMTWDRLATGLSERGAQDGYYVDLFETKGFVSILFDGPKQWPFRWERNRLRGEIRVDVAVYRRAISFGEAVVERRIGKGAMPTTECGGFGVPQEIVLPTSKISFLGDDFDCPNQPEAYLRILYGDFRKVEYTYINEAAANARSGVDIAGNPPTA